MKKLIILLLLFVGLKSFSQAPVNVSQAQYFLKYIWVKDSVRATIYFQGTNDTLATQAYVRAHMGSGASGIAGFGIKISNDSFSVDTTKLIKQDSMWVVNDTTFIIKINSRLTTFHMRGAVVSYNGRVGAIVSNPADYSAFYVSLTGTYNNPVWLNSFAWTKLSGVPSTLVGYGIIDGVTNLGGSQTWASGTFAARPAAGNINGAFYMAKDTNAIYFDNGASWQKVAGGTGSGSDSGIVATNGILKTVSSTTITLKSDTSLLATRYDIARDSIYNGATFYPLTNPSAYINLTSISALPPMLYNNSIGVISADTSAGLTHLATQAYVKSLTDTNGVHPIGTGSPMIQTLFAGTGGDLRTSRWGPGLFTIPRLASDSLAFMDLDTSAIGYKSWIIAQYGPGTGSQKPTLDSVLAYGDTAYQKQMIISWDAFGGPVTHPYLQVYPDSVNGFFSVGDVNRTNLFLIMSQKTVGIMADSGLYIKAGGNTQFTALQTQAAQNSTVKRLKLPNTGNLIDTLATLSDTRGASNIYNSNGLLAGPRTVNLNNNDLLFTNTGSNNQFQVINVNGSTSTNFELYPSVAQLSNTDGTTTSTINQQGNQISFVTTTTTASKLSQILIYSDTIKLLPHRGMLVIDTLQKAANMTNKTVMLYDTTTGYWSQIWMGGFMPPNLGSGFRIWAPQTPGFKTFACTGCTLDSVTTGQIGLTVTDATISTSNIATNNVSITKHGWTPIAPNDATKFLDGTGNWSTPAGGGGGNLVDSVVTITSGTSSTVPNGTNIIQFNNTTFLTYTLTLPTNWHPLHDLMISFTSNGTITNGMNMVNLTIVHGSGHTISFAVDPSGVTYNAGENIGFHLIGTVEQREAK